MLEAKREQRREDRREPSGAPSPREGGEKEVIGAFNSILERS